MSSRYAGSACRPARRPSACASALGGDEPPHAAAKAAFRARAEVRHYPCDHFDLFPGKPWHEAAVAHASLFLTRHLSVRGAEPARA